jgi:phage tail-like protein
MELLPPVYREDDESGDLAAFLKLPGTALDELKELADRLLWNFDVDACEPRFLPYLAALVGWPWDPTRDATEQRRRIREAVEFYRRKGTLPAIQRSLGELGWEGWIEETFRSAFRLNRRARLNTKKLPGQVFSYGVYRVHSTEQPPDLWVGLRPHHPAGTRVLFLRSFQLGASLEAVLEGYVKTLARMVALARLHEAFVMNRSHLNSHDPLTGRQRGATSMIASQSTFARQGFERAQTCVRTWQAPTPCFRLNRGKLNLERLANVWVSELVSAWCCCIAVDEVLPAAPSVVRLNRPRLNRNRLVKGTPASCCGWSYRQRDLVADAMADAAEVLESASESRWTASARLDPRLTLGRSTVGGDPLGPGAEDLSLLIVHEI